MKQSDPGSLYRILFSTPRNIEVETAQWTLNNETVECATFVIEMVGHHGESNAFEIAAHAVPKIYEPIAIRSPIPPLRRIQEAGLPLAEDWDEVRSGSWNGEIDLSIGTKHFWSVLTGRSQRLGAVLMALESRFGWVVHGDTCLAKSRRIEQCLHARDPARIAIEETNAMLTKLFDAPVQEVAENGVELPVNQEMAVRLAWSLLRRLRSRPNVLQAYDATFAEYERRGILEPLGSNPPVAERMHVLPHHPVVRADKASTKVRLVLNAAAHEFREPRLTDCMHAGPNLNNHKARWL